MQKLGILLVWLVLPVMVVAQSPATLTLEECIRRAEQYSFLLKSDEHEISAATNTASLLQTKVLPTIDAELATDNRFLKPFYFNQTWTAIHADWSLGDYLKKTGRSADQDVETQRWLKEQDRLDIIGRSSSLFLSILQVLKQKEILTLRVSLLKTHHELNQGMWKSGLRSQLDVLQTEAEMVKICEDTSRLGIVQQDLQNELSHLLGFENSRRLKLIPLEVSSIVAKPVPEMNRRTFNNNPMLSAYDSKVIAQNLRTEEMLADLYPHIRMGSGFVADGDPSGDGPYFQINAGVIMPIYYSHEPQYKKQWSEAIVESLKSQKLDAERELLIHVMQVYDRLIKLKDLLLLQHEQQVIATNMVRIAEINYKSGISTNLEFISAQEQFTNIELSIEATHLEYTMNLIEFFIKTNQVDQIASLGN